MLSGNHKKKSEASKNREKTVRVTNRQKEKAEKEEVSKIEIKLQFRYVVPTQCENRTTADAHLPLCIRTRQYLISVPVTVGAMMR